jgi:trk system potassium uptake protein TrkA
MLDFIPLSNEFDLIQFNPPQNFLNHSLKDLNLRVKYNVHIIAIKKPAPEGFVLVPPANYEIQAADTLIILGKSEDIKKIKGLM